ncbi:MAG: DUF4364 family protein [Clostridia bacterium]
MKIVDENQAAENKLTLIYVLRQIQMPMSKKHLVSFILKGNFMNFFLIPHYIDELSNGGYIDSHEGMYTLSPKGGETLEFLFYKLPASVRSKVDSLLRKERDQIKREINVTADYTTGMRKDFISALKISDNGDPLMELSLSCGTKKEAMRICEHFKKNAHAIYQQVTDILLPK